MRQIRALGLALLVFSLSGCFSIAITDPNSPPSSGIGFGEELFRLQGRVDYLYGHVLRNQQKLELQVGDLQRSMQNLEQGTELSALRSDVSRLRDDLSQLKRKIAAPQAVADRTLKEKIDELYKQISNTQLNLEARMSRLEEMLVRTKAPQNTPTLTPKAVGYLEEPAPPATNSDNSNRPMPAGDGR